MNELTHRPFFGIDGYDEVNTDPFDVLEDALECWLCRGDERPHFVRIEVYTEQPPYVPQDAIEELAYRIAEDLFVDHEQFHVTKALIAQRVTWALQTCRTDTFLSAGRYLEVRVVSDGDEAWELAARDFDVLRQWWEMETKMMRFMTPRDEP